MLRARKINNLVIFNNIPFENKTRIASGQHKANVIQFLIENGYEIGCHFEDDPVQAAIIRRETTVPVIMIGSNEFTNLENVRHEDF